MNVQRFQAPTLRDALAKARKAFGEGTLILANRSTAEGYEVVATAEQVLAEATRAGVGGEASAASGAPLARRLPAGEAAADAKAPAQGSRQQIEHDTERLAMSTLSFQEYVRERMMARRQAEQRTRDGGVLGDMREIDAMGQREAARDATRDVGRDMARDASGAAPRAALHDGERPAAPTSAAQGAAAAQNFSAAAGSRASSLPSAPVDGAAQLLERLQSMQDRIEQRLDTVAWLGQARHSAIHAGLLLKLLRAGYSSAFARELVQGVSPELQPAEAVRAAAQAIAARVLSDQGEAGIVAEGGKFALTGPAGWGKTTMVMKLVAAAVQQHGAGSVGLVTLDVQRAGAPEALRQAARTHGAVAHVAHDRAALLEMLSLLERKALVLIDTASHGPRDAQLRETLEMATWPGIQQLLVLNAAAQAETIDATLVAFRTPQLGGALLTRMDEAVKLGPAVDALVRHQVRLRGLGTGPRAPEDLVPVDAFELVKQSLRSPARSVYDPQAEDLALHFAAGPEAAPGRPILEG